MRDSNPNTLPGRQSDAGGNHKTPPQLCHFLLLQSCSMLGGGSYDLHRLGRKLTSNRNSNVCFLICDFDYLLLFLIAKFMLNSFNVMFVVSFFAQMSACQAD